ncbi:2639_t:CDS:2 [Paraglomus brasilianum]|uniref:2639_t:CDS:1 n=1 Tax=Paraglomus brasilianum TaxID=144538 RepID=A0A9N9CT58_9GLOM|nr:2639_t:CDS:2 [Paraglomus brasilianum]
MAGPRGSHVVFVGNIPYELTEEQLTEIFKEVGPVVSFRLVFDRETGRPRGYGFCEYHDAETAASAVRNLNNVEVGGRPLRVDYADGDPAATSSSATMAEKSGIEGRGMQPAVQQSSSSQQPQQTPLMTQASLPQGSGPQQSAVDTISKNLATMSPNQLYDVLAQVKLLIQNNIDQARALLTQNPQLSYALFQSMLLLNVVEPAVLQRGLQSNIQAAPQPNQQPNQQPPSHPPPPPIVSNVPFPQTVPQPGNVPPAQSQPPAAMYPGIAQPAPPLMQQPIQSIQPQQMPQQMSQPVLQAMQQVMGVPGTAGGDMQIQEQRNLLLQVLRLTQQQIDSLPPEQRNNIMQLKAQIMLSQTP